KNHPGGAFAGGFYGNGTPHTLGSAGNTDFSIIKFSCRHISLNFVSIDCNLSPHIESALTQTKGNNGQHLFRIFIIRLLLYHIQNSVATQIAHHLGKRIRQITNMRQECHLGEQGADSNQLAPLKQPSSPTGNNKMSSPTAKTRTWGYSLLARAATAPNRKKWAIGFLAFSLQVPATLWAAADSDTDFGSRIINADKEPHNWLSHGRSYGEARYSPLNQINQNNVEKLGLAWFYDLDTSRGQEATPLVVDGVLYTSSAWSKVQAFDAATGRLLWQFDPKVPGETAIKGCCDVVNRGVAYWDGMVYVGALDGRLIAIDAKTGQQIWSTMTVDASLNYTITGAPRIVKGKVIIGNSGAEFGVRGYVTAYDAKSGDQVWR